MASDENSSNDNFVDDVTVPIRFGLGTVSLSLRELKSIQPGFVFQLDRDGTNPVMIEVNGTMFGRGDLVLVGGRLAVHFTEVTSHANDSS